MGRSLSITAIVAAAFGFLGALILGVDARFVLAIVGIVAAVFLFLLRDMRGYVLGGLALVLSVAGALGVVGNVSTEDGGVEFPVSVNAGSALLIVAMTLPAAAIVWGGWEEMADWVKYVGAGAVALTIITAFVFSGDFGDQTLVGGFVVAFLCLATSIPGIMAMRADGE